MKIKKIEHKEPNIFCSTWQSLYKMPKKYFERFNCIFVDECFSGNMRVLTPFGYKKIKELNDGDVIINYDETKKVFKEDEIVKRHKNIKKSEGEKMYRLNFDNGNTIEVTGNHKFLTTEGWVRADELTESHDIINIS